MFVKNKTCRCSVVEISERASKDFYVEIYLVSSITPFEVYCLGKRFIDSRDLNLYDQLDF